jgi:Fe2+ transport system protein FeoA
MEQPTDSPTPPNVTNCGCDRPGQPSACSLNRLGVGCRGSVASVSGQPELRRRLMEMGLCDRAEVEVVRRAPMGDPIEVKVRGYCLSLRNDQAACVQVTTA